VCHHSYNCGYSYTVVVVPVPSPLQKKKKKKEKKNKRRPILEKKSYYSKLFNTFHMFRKICSKKLISANTF